MLNFRTGNTVDFSGGRKLNKHANGTSLRLNAGGRSATEVLCLGTLQWEPVDQAPWRRPIHGTSRVGGWALIPRNKRTVLSACHVFLEIK